MKYKNKQQNTNNKIKSELISKELTELIKTLLAVIFLAITFGYAGYTYSIDNNQDIKHGIVFGSLFPLGIVLIKKLGLGNIVMYIIYTIAYICFIDYVPTLVGFIILFVIIALFIVHFIYIKLKDRTEEISRINANKNYTIPNATIAKPKEIIKEDYIPIIEEKIYDDAEKEIFEEEEYECERCFKKISYEEYEINDCMCEDCYQDVHTDKYGNFHDDEYFDF